MPKKPNPISRYFPEIDSVKHSPRFQIIVANGVFETLVNALIEVKCKNQKSILEGNHYTYAIKLTILNEGDLISNRQFQLLKAFNKLRNEAAHGDFVLTDDKLNPFKVILKDTFETDYYLTGNFSDFCNALVIGLWNDHRIIFGTHFRSMVLG